MTDRQLELEEQKLRQLPKTKENLKRATELSCIDMINSIIAYAPMSHHSVAIIDYISSNSYMKKYVDTLGVDRVQTLAVNQINSISFIAKNVYTDCEGVTYNSIKWLE